MKISMGKIVNAGKWNCNLSAETFQHRGVQLHPWKEPCDSHSPKGGGSPSVIGKEMHHFFHLLTGLHYVLTTLRLDKNMRNSFIFTFFIPSSLINFQITKSL